MNNRIKKSLEESAKDLDNAFEKIISFNHYRRDDSDNCRNPELSDEAEAIYDFFASHFTDNLQSDGEWKIKLATLEDAGRQYVSASFWKGDKQIFGPGTGTVDMKGSDILEAFAGLAYVVGGMAEYANDANRKAIQEVCRSVMALHAVQRAAED